MKVTAAGLATLLLAAGALGFEDHTHASAVFGTSRTYRICFPADYASTTQRFPVVYFFHGWGGRYNFDPHCDVSVMDGVVSNSPCILVAWDGNIEPGQPRPYNVGYHKDIVYPVQMKDYFLELIRHVDATYRTVPDREHRAVMGFSMGGFMAFYLAGKYPDKVCGAVNFVGSPEFFVGYPGNHTHYPLRDGFGNLLGVNLRFHRTDGDELFHLNNEVAEGARREVGLLYETDVYPGPHSIDPDGGAVRFKASFDFLMKTFASPPALPVRWHHADLYPEFSVFGWEVKSDLAQPGYIDLHGVTAGGLRTGTRKWLPDGPAVPGVSIRVQTPARYQPDTAHTLFIYRVARDAASSVTVRSDASGRIAFAVGHDETQIGLYTNGAPPEIVVAGYSVEGGGLFLKQGHSGRVRLTLLNRGGTPAAGVQVAVASSSDGVSLGAPPNRVERIDAGHTAAVVIEVKPSCPAPPDGRPWWVRLNVRMSDGKGREWADELDVPVWFDVPSFGDLAIDDGRALNGLSLGTGNGDGVVNPGERVMIGSGSQRLRLYTDDPYVDGEAETLHDELLPSVWEDGYTFSSVIKIRDNCPAGRAITFLASRETKTGNPIRRIVTWGTVNVTITGR